MKIYVPSETYTGKPIIYLEDDEKEDLEEMESAERDYFIWLGEVCMVDNQLFANGNMKRRFYPIPDAQCRYEVIRLKRYLRPDGGMADTADLKSASIRCEGSNPFPGTISPASLCCRSRGTSR